MTVHSCASAVNTVSDNLEGYCRRESNGFCTIECQSALDSLIGACDAIVGSRYIEQDNVEHLWLKDETLVNDSVQCLFHQSCPGYGGRPHTAFDEMFGDNLSISCKHYYMSKSAMLLHARLTTNKSITVGFFRDENCTDAVGLINTRLDACENRGGHYHTWVEVTAALGFYGTFFCFGNQLTYSTDLQDSTCSVSILKGRGYPQRFSLTDDHHQCVEWTWGLQLLNSRNESQEGVDMRWAHQGKGYVTVWSRSGSTEVCGSKYPDRSMVGPSGVVANVSRDVQSQRGLVNTANITTTTPRNATTTLTTATMTMMTAQPFHNFVLSNTTTTAAPRTLATTSIVSLVYGNAGNAAMPIARALVEASLIILGICAIGRCFVIRRLRRNTYGLPHVVEDSGALHYGSNAARDLELNLTATRGCIGEATGNYVAIAT